MKHTLSCLTALLLTPLAVLHAGEPVSLSADHAAAVNHQRRIFFQYDPGADIQLKGGFGSDMESLMDYVYDFADMPGSQLDALCLVPRGAWMALRLCTVLPASATSRQCPQGPKGVEDCQRGD